jgi:hypothetical protein
VTVASESSSAGIGSHWNWAKPPSFVSTVADGPDAPSGRIHVKPVPPRDLGRDRHRPSWRRQVVGISGRLGQLADGQRRGAELQHDTTQELGEVGEVREQGDVDVVQALEIGQAGVTDDLRPRYLDEAVDARLVVQRIADAHGQDARVGLDLVGLDDGAIERLRVASGVAVGAVAHGGWGERVRRALEVVGRRVAVGDEQDHLRRGAGPGLVERLIPVGVLVAGACPPAGGTERVGADVLNAGLPPSGGIGL